MAPRIITQKVLEGAQDTANFYESVLENAGDFSGLPTSQISSYDQRYDSLLKLQTRLQRFITSGGEQGSLTNIKRDLGAVGITNPDDYVKYGAWQTNLAPWLESHHGWGGLKVQEQVGLLPPGKHYNVTGSLLDDNIRLGQPKGGNLWGLPRSFHRGMPNSNQINPWYFGSRNLSAHGGIGNVFNPLKINTGGTSSEIVQQIKTGLTPYEGLNKQVSERWGYVWKGLEPSIEGLDEKAITQVVQEVQKKPGMLDFFYREGGGKPINFKWVGKNVVDVSGKLFSFSKGIWKPVTATTLATGAYSLFPGTLSAKTLKDHGASPEFIAAYTLEQAVGKGGAFATGLTVKKAVPLIMQRLGKGMASKYAASLFSGPAIPWVLGTLAAKDIWDVTNILTDGGPNKFVGKFSTGEPFSQYGPIPRTTAAQKEAQLLNQPKYGPAY